MNLKKVSLRSLCIVSSATVFACMYLFAACAVEETSSVAASSVCETATSTTTTGVVDTTTMCEVITIEQSNEDPRKTSGKLVYDDMTYILDEHGLLTIRGKGVVDSTWKAVLNEDAVKDVSIEIGATEIGEQAFSGCDGIESFFVPYGVSKIGSGAFSDCKNLKFIDFAESLKTIDSFAFKGCTALEYVGIAESVESIDDTAFTYDNNVVIYGYRDSYAETFAEKQSMKFTLNEYSNLEKGETDYYPSETSVETTAVSVETSATSVETTAVSVETSATSVVAARKAIEKLNPTLSETSFIYTGSPIQPKVIINGLTKGKDFKVAYSNNVNAGTATATITGIGEYQGVIRQTFQIVKKKIVEKYVELDKVDFPYTGGKIQPTVKILDLKKDKDFTVSYKNNIKIGTASVTVNGIGNYRGTVTKTFRIVDSNNTKSINGKTIAVSPTTCPYTGKEITPKVTIGGLKENVDFVVLYEDNIDVGKGTVKVAGIDKYSGTIERQFIITAKRLVQSDLKLSKTSYNYTGKEITPEIKIGNLKKDEDFIVAYSNNVKAGTATITVKGIGKNVTGTIVATFKIVQTTKTIEKMTATLSESSIIYTGNAIEPAVTIKGLTKDKDFVVAYSNNVNAGTATVIITGKGEYKGVIKQPFQIVKKKIVEKYVELDKSEFSYTGEKIQPNVKILDLKKGRDFTVSYQNNINVGTATVTVKGIGNYRGTVNITFSIYMPKSED